MIWRKILDQDGDENVNLVKRHSGPPRSVGWLCRRVGGVRSQLLGQFPVSDGGAGAD